MKPRHHFYFFLAVLMVYSWTGYSAEGADGMIFLDPHPDVRYHPKFKKIAAMVPGSQPYEYARIDYLLDRIKRSSYTFRRNGVIYPSVRAMQHLKWKYWKYKKEVLTAEDFVEKIASGSRASGEGYSICLTREECYPARDILTNELTLLTGTLVRYHVRPAGMAALNGSGVSALPGGTAEKTSGTSDSRKSENGRNS